MPIRPANYGDLRPAAEVAAAAFIEDSLFGELMHPHRHQYPEDFIRFWEQEFRVKWLQPKYSFLVAISDGGKVVGLAIWEREKTDHFVGNLAHRLASLYNKYEKWMWPNHAADPSKANVLDESKPLIEHHWSGAREQNWYLDLLAVHPEYQGKMYGRELVQWGIEEAKREGICASVIAAEGKDRFYGRFGFVEVGRANVGPLAGIEGGAIMFNDLKL
ncbi:putative GNAT family acetyltransferase [Stipitochalara longipes BDJ]|nr:putative GNAT family acetyltransferase [Stipitochalara longipes BDJ]